MRRFAVLIAFAGCSGGHHGAGPDAAEADAPATIDAATSDAALPPDAVEVVVADGFAPIANVRVVFIGADGARTEAMTDAAGAASASMPMGGAVQVVRTYASATEPTDVFDYVGVEAGDVLHVGSAYDTTLSPTSLPVTVPAPAQGLVDVALSCGVATGQGPIVHVDVGACPANVIVYAHDAAQEGFAVPVPYAPAIDLGQQALVGDLSTTLLAYDVTPDLASVAAEARAMDGTHVLFTTGPRRVDQQSQQRGIPDLDGVVDQLVVGTIVASAGGTQIVASRRLWKPQPVSVDGSGHLLPYLRAPATFAPTTITWTEDGTATVDAVAATFTVKHGATTYRRTILAPHAGASLAVPAADAAYTPVDGDAITGSVGLVGATAGYRAVRPWAFGVGDLADATTPDNTLTLSFAGTTPPL